MIKIAVIVLPVLAIGALVIFYGWFLVYMAVAALYMLVIGLGVFIYTCFLPEKYSPNGWQISIALFIIWVCLAYFMYYTYPEGCLWLK